MATVRIIPPSVPAPPPPPVEIVLTMSMNEVNALSAVLCRVGGSPVHSPRKFIEAIYDALKAKGISYLDSPYYPALSKEGGLRFEDHTL